MLQSHHAGHFFSHGFPLLARVHPHQVALAGLAFGPETVNFDGFACLVQLSLLAGKSLNFQIPVKILPVEVIARVLIAMVAQ
jgi:hypothetical protein